MDVKLIDVLTSLPVCYAILPPAVCFARSRPANHAICCYIDSSGHASGPIRICLFIAYILKSFTDFPSDKWTIFQLCVHNDEKIPERHAGIVTNISSVFLDVTGLTSVSSYNSV